MMIEMYGGALSAALLSFNSITSPMRPGEARSPTLAATALMPNGCSQRARGRRKTADSSREASERSVMRALRRQDGHRDWRQGLTIQMFWSHQCDQVLQLLAVALSTIEAQEHPCRCRVSPLCIRTSRDHL